MEHSEHRNKESGDHEMVLIFGAIIAFIAVSAWISKESDVFISWWKVLYLPQAKAIAWFSTTFLGEVVNYLLGHTSGQASGLVQFIENTTAHDMTAHFCWEASSFLGKYYLFVFIPLGSYLTIKVYKKTQGESEVYQKFKNAKEFTQFVRKNALDAHEMLDEANKRNKGDETQRDGISDALDDENNKKNKKSKGFNPEELASSLSLIDFAKAHNLLMSNNKERLNPKNVHECFVKQLGDTFTYIEDLINKPYGWAAIKVLQFIPEKYRAKTLEEASKRHPYDFTILIALLDSARRYGVVPSSIFIRLKQHYPSLWYGLNNLGRKVAFVEGAGLSAQYAHEVFQKQYRNLKPKPQCVQAAVDGFEEAFQSEENN